MTALGAGRPMVVPDEIWGMAEEEDVGSRRLLATGC